ncbi:ABC transporter substrate-binding protein [Microbacterium halotolerans]|uniref:ABC transporter substrate-binding protein n=1 Tax=Microbacterium halotolerans TaxID=246613 RepID=UPI000E6AD70F|nr:ABC transporter substrate-binding protein [Microbacterium halotolerans]
MLSRRTSAAGFLTAAAAASLITGCSSGGGSTADADGVTHITAASQSNPTGFSLWLAEELGYFDEAELDVEIQYAENGGALLASGAAGDWQAGWIGAPPLLTGYDSWGLLPTGSMLTENKNIILFMDNDVLDGSSPAEALASTPVGVVANSVSAQLLFACADSLGVEASDIETVPLDPAAIVNGMLNDDIDAGVAFAAGNWPLVEDPDKYAQVCDGDKAGAQLIDPYMITPAFWSENPDAAAAYLDAVYRANEYILDTPQEEVTPHLMDFLDSIGADFPEEVAEYSLSVKNYFTLDEALEQMRSGAFSDGLTDTAEFLVDAGVYDEMPDIEAMTAEGIDVLQAAADYRN